MRFGNPWWLAAGLAACALLVLIWRLTDARQHAALAKFVAAHLRSQLTRSISLSKRRAQRVLFLVAIIGLFAALAGPLVGYRWVQLSHRGNEILFAIDTSRSMLTPDVKPSRLTRAKLAIDDFVQRLDGDAVGIVAFAGTAFLACPMTLDYGAFHESLRAIDTHTIPRGGTNISSAIRAAQMALRRRPGSDKILILVTDGEDLEGDALAAARTAAQTDGLKIYAVGVGTAGGDLIPVSQDSGGGFVKDDKGSFVRSRLDAAALQAIAAASGGIYAPLGTQGEGLDAVFAAIFGSIQKHDLAYRQQKVYIQRYQWPLAASLAALLASLLIGNRRRRSASSASTQAAIASAGLLLMIASPIQPMRAANASSGENAPAAPVAGDAKNPVLEYNNGTTAYRAGLFPQAAQAFQQSIVHAPSSDLKRLADQQDAYYDLGNTLYRAGQKTEQSAPQETLQKWSEAVKAYETALQLRADDADAKFNRDFVQRKIDALKQQRNPDQNPDQNQNQPNKGSGQPGQPPPGGQRPPGGQPPPGGRPPPGAQPPPGNQPPPGGQPPQGNQPPPSPGEPQPGDDAARDAENQRAPGQMSREEARELLDSAKGDERRALGAPLARREAMDPPEKPYKDW